MFQSQINHFNNCVNIIRIIFQWMGAIRMRVQTAGENIAQVIHNPSVHQLTSCEMKSCVFVRNKSIIKMFQLQKSSFHNIAFSSEKLTLSESGEKYAQS